MRSLFVFGGKYFETAVESAHESGLKILGFGPVTSAIVLFFAWFLVSGTAGISRGEPATAAAESCSSNGRYS